MGAPEENWEPDPAERPEVFSEKSYEAVIRFARRFNRLIVPAGTEAIEAYEANYGTPEGMLSEKDLSEITSIKELAAYISNQNSEIIRKELGEVLAGAKTSRESRPTRGKQSLWKGKDRRVILDIIADGVFDDFDEDREELVETVLGLSAIMERATSETMARALETLPTEKLEQFGMTPRREKLSLAF